MQGHSSHHCHAAALSAPASHGEDTLGDITPGASLPLGGRDAVGGPRVMQAQVALAPLSCVRVLCCAVPGCSSGCPVLVLGMLQGWGRKGKPQKLVFPFSWGTPEVSTLLLQG